MGTDTGPSSRTHGDTPILRGGASAGREITPAISQRAVTLNIQLGMVVITDHVQTWTRSG